MTPEEIVEKYSGTFPDPYRRSLFKTWAQMNEAMRKDIEEYGRLKWNQACEEQRKECDLFHFAQHGCLLKIDKAPKPEFKP